MYTREVSEIFNVGWPDPDWIKGFSVAIRPLVELDPEFVSEVMTTESVPGIDPKLGRNTFDKTRLQQLKDMTQLIVIRNVVHCGKPNSRMHEFALASLDYRLDVLLGQG